MSQIFGPYGLRVVKNLGETPFSGGIHTYRAASLTPYATQGLYFGDPVGLQGGNVVPLAASPVAGVPGVIGVFQGASWQDPIRGFVNAQYLPAGLTTATASDVQIKVVDYPWVVMRVQANGPVTVSQLGLNGALTSFTSGSVFTGNSAVCLDTVTTPPAATATLGVRIYGFVRDAAPSPGAGSLPGDAYTDVLVVWNFGIDRYLNATGG